MGEPKISIIIRTKNEERWITFCLDMIFKQTHKNIEVILVDNQSTDYTIKLAKKYPIKIVTIKKYMPGKALNKGIRASTGQYIVCLSAHCIPKNTKWLTSLLKNFKNPKVAGVYGRQEPLPSSEPTDIRDLVITFGLDHRIQKKDSFFHNANSMIRHDVWKEIPFDEKATNIEDRIWGKAVIQAGYYIAYEPAAAVYHHHGIHQAGDQERAKKVVRIIRKVEDSLALEKLPPPLDPQNLEVVALLPVRGKALTINDHDLLKNTLLYLKSSDLVKKIYVLADRKSLQKNVEAMGAELILRPKNLSAPAKSVEDVLKFGVSQLNKKRVIPDIILYVNYLFPFRPKHLVHALINDLLAKGLDSVAPALPDYSPFWIDRNDSLERVDAGFMTREKKKPLARGIIGLGCATLPRFVKEGRLLGDKVGVIPLKNQLYGLRIVNKADEFNIKVAKLFLKTQNY